MSTAAALDHEARPLEQVRQYRSLYDLLHGTLAEHGDGTAYRVRDGSGWRDYSWSEAGELVNRVARSFIALGVEHGDRVAILSRTRLEWCLADLGTQCAGGVTVGLYQSLLAADCAYVVNHSDAAIVVAEDAEQLGKILEVRDDLPKLRHIVLVCGESDESGVIGWDAFLARGDAVDVERVHERGNALTRDDLAALVYTSGTTGVPKGAMISHGNLLFSVWSSSHLLDYRPHYVTVMFLPLAHVFARMIAVSCLAGGNTMVFCTDLDRLGDYIREIRPEFLVSVPRIYEKIHDRILARVESEGGLKKKLFDWAISVGIEVSRHRQRREPVSGMLSLKFALADRLVLHKITDALGGRLAWAVSGSAPLNPVIAEFFDACGVIILEGIGMTENTSFSNVNTLALNKFGTVGPPGPGIEMKIAEDGEVLYRAENVMQGYFKSPEATADAITADGWLKTGDIGEVDEDGYLKITDRKKDLIITAGGKNVAPARVERALRTSRFISQAIAYGDKKKYLVALVTLDETSVGEWAVQRGIETANVAELAAHPRVHELIADEVERGNQELASYETIKRFHILPRDLSIEEGDLTPTMKVKRRAVCDRYRGELNGLYDD
jgi:long-chain acyl-CoA synthetase